MSRKDFELIARVFNREMGLSGGDERGRKYLVGGLARLLATELEGTNPRFDRERFLKACGVS
jgi:hypothetical protein